MRFEIMIPRRPLSVGSTNKSRQRWKDQIQKAARLEYYDEPLSDAALRLTIVFFYTNNPVDVDNIIKPIQDALKGILYLDDRDIVDVHSYRRKCDEVISTDDWPPRLVDAYNLKSDCVYILVRDAFPEVCL